MGHVEVSLKLFDERGLNILSPEYYSYRTIKEKKGRLPVLEDFSSYDCEAYQIFLNKVELCKKLSEPGASVYIRFNHGARAGSIAKVLNPQDIFKQTASQYTNLHGPRYDFDAKVEVQWDDGKKWSFKFDRHIDSKVVADNGGKHHDFLFDYDGPTTRAFEKKARVELPPAVVHDAYGRVIKVGDWVMDKMFRIGQIQRISGKGTMWIKFLQQSLGRNYKTKAYVEQFGRSSSEVVILEVPEGFETTAVIMDNDISDFVITPTFRFGFSADD